jgi:hypothetical protein
LTANRNQDAKPLVEVERLLKTVSDAWNAIRPEAVTHPASTQTWGVLPAADSLDAHPGHSWSA